ncbi:ABC transporter ATP-binding protein [Corynebacterium sp. P7202]|uniref:ABC transporter ATP-binding protein n=1 Tax=Corynebacterium pygosceleis TaxID=2800406 RepID=A0A9Q4CAJ9_9CORY|nr:ABC transporter ATP-binding protein [Corynebacterium pygosceleis]MCK7637192.1 ABC transporter ATP-binding protein [Corynebacterium pygosceleis]MCX7468480.1 ABC transporter ATP-binding protein [Corynebacterium pygosceleis]
MKPLLCDSLSKTFGTVRALDGLTLEVEEGSVHGFLGPNGAGKSTTIRILLGLLHPDRGTVQVLGSDPRSSPEVLRRVAYVPAEVTLWPQLTGAETIHFLAKLRGGNVNEKRRAELIEAFQLDVNRRNRDYSTGNRRKVLLIAALSADADLLILDEPTSGLDPLMEQVFEEQIIREAKRGATVLLSSHIMSEVEKLCDSVTVIKSGRVVLRGQVDDLKQISAHHVSAHFDGGVPEHFRSLSAVSVDGSRLTATIDREESTDLLRRIIESGGHDITSTPASLEDIFLDHYAEER